MAKKNKADKIAQLADAIRIWISPFPTLRRKHGSSCRLTASYQRRVPAYPSRRGTNACRNPVPNVVLKVPTGGGKTWLAVGSLSRIFGRFLSRNTGFALWVVPNEAIYTQTLRNLKDRQHPYRQALDRAAAGRVLLLEKGDRLDARDVESNLCLMLLMLQSANREQAEQLRVSMDRGDVRGFFPPEGDQSAHAAAIEATPQSCRL